MEHEYSIKDLIDVALKRYNFDESITQGKVEQAYRDVVGVFIVKLTRSVKYDRDSHTLNVVLASPALKNELMYKVSSLKDSINNQLGKKEVWTIMFY